MSVITDFLTNFTQFFAPDVAIVPTAVASATTAAQGQFSTTTDAIKIASRTSTTTTIAVKLRKSKAANSAVDATSPLTIIIAAEVGQAVTAPKAEDVTVGTFVSQIGGGSQFCTITVMPDASGIVTMTIVTSTVASTVQLRHRTFATTFAAT